MTKEQASELGAWATKDGPEPEWLHESFKACESGTVRDAFAKNHDAWSNI